MLNCLLFVAKVALVAAPAIITIAAFIACGLSQFL